jgi:hypothetical protein
LIDSEKGLNMIYCFTDLMERKGIITIVYDSNGSLYFLIVHSNKEEFGWGFPKALIRDEDNPEEIVSSVAKSLTGIQQFDIKEKLSENFSMEILGENYLFDVFLIEASMNSPVNINNQVYDTYLWATDERSAEKISLFSERELLQKVTFHLRNN